MDFISRPEISFWMPIIVTAVMVAASLYNVQMQLALLTQEVRNNNDIYQTYKKVLDSEIDTLNSITANHEGRLTKLETILDINATAK